MFNTMNYMSILKYIYNLIILFTFFILQYNNISSIALHAVYPVWWYTLWVIVCFLMSVSRQLWQRSLRLGPQASIKEIILRSSSGVMGMLRMPQPHLLSPNGALMMRRMKMWMMTGMPSLRGPSPAPLSPVRAKRRKND